MANNKQIRREIVLTANGKAAEDMMKALSGYSNKLTKELKALAAAGKSDTKEFKELQAVQKTLNKQMKENISDTQRIDRVMKDLAGSSTKQLRSALNALRREMDKTSEAEGKLPAMREQFRKIQEQIDKNTGAVKKHGSAWSTAAKNLTAYVGLFAVFNKAKQLFTDFFRLNQEFSDQLVNIRKVSNLAMEDIERMSKNLAKIDTRTTIEELNQIAYAGAKLGIGDYGVGALESFTRAANQVNVALKEDLGEEALTALSKITQVMGLIPKLGVEDAMLRTGSAIFKLASTSTATSQAVIDFSNRLLSMGKQGALSTADILALGAAVDSMALEPEVASTAFNKMIVEIRKGTTSLEKDLGIAEGKLKAMVEAGNGMGALQEIFQKMHETGNVFALDTLFKDMGSEGGARMVKTMVTMADNVEILNKAVRTANQAFDEGSAVTAEYNMQQETAKAYMERASNAWEKFFVNAQNANGPIKEIAESWYDMTKSILGAGEATGGFRLAIDTLVFSCKAFISLIPALVSGLMAKGVGAALIKLGPLFKSAFDMGVAGIRSLIPALGAGAAATGGFTAKWKAMDAAMKSNVIALAVGAFVQLVYWASQYERELTSLEKAQLKVNEVKENAIKTIQDETLKIESLNKMAHDETIALEDRKKAIDILNETIPDYNGLLDETTGKYTANERALRKYNDELLRNAEIEGAKSSIAELSGQLAAAKAKRFKAEQELENTPAPSASTGGGSIYDYSNSKYLYEQGARVKAENAVKAANKEVEDLQAELDALKDLYGDDIAKSYIQVGAEGKEIGEEDKCPQCGASLPKGAKKCPYCGWGTGGGNSNPDKQESQIAKDRANALIANIKAFYEEQQRKYIEWVAKQNEEEEVVSEGQQKVYLDHLETQMKTALGKARQSIATLDDGWKQFYEHMDEDVAVYDDETSKQLLESIGKADVEQLHALFEKLSGDLSRENNRTLSENLGALLDQIFANGSKELREAAEKLLAHQRDIQKILNEHDYTGTVDRSTRSNLDAIGLLNPASGVNADTQEGLQKMNDAFDKLTEKARKSIVELYNISPESEDFQEQFLSFLSVAGDGFDFASLKASELKALYLEIIKYNDEYDAAQKKRDDERKKLNNYMWSRSGTQKFDQAAIDLSGEQSRESARQYSFGAKADTITPWGQTEATDPELALLQLKMKLAKDYYDYIKAHGATDEQLIEAGKNVSEAYSSIMDAIVTKAKATAEAQMKWYKPIEQYGTALGEAMMDESKTVKDATRDMINSFIDLTGEYVNQKLTQWIMTKLYNSMIAESETELTTQKQANAVTNATTAVTEASVEVPAGIAAASAKTLGTLGWWGIPLIAVIGGVLGGLMALAKGALSKAFGSKTPDAGKTNTKLVSGMLTYDSGNVQDLKPFFDKDGNMYWATEDDTKHSGVSLLTSPTATTINGAPSLVAENGPELVIGRETTKAMMQNNPALLKALYAYDKNHSGRTAYDTGNVGSTLGGRTYEQSGTDSDTRAMIAGIAQMLPALMARLNEPISAKIDMYGRGNLYDSMNKANQFMKGK